MFAQRVEFMDGGARGQHQLGCGLLLGERYGRRRIWSQSGSAARGQEDHQIPWTGLRAKFGDPARRLDTALVRNRMPAGTQFDAPALRRVTVLHRYAAGKDPFAQNLLCGARHGTPGLARASHEYAFVAIQIAAFVQSFCNRGCGIGRCQSGLQYRLSVLTQVSHVAPILLSDGRRR